MRDITIARNYAETLAALAQRAGDLDGWGTMLDEVADAIQRDARLRNFIDSPRIAADQKNVIIGKAFSDRLPRLFVRFLEAVITNRRQHLIPEIAVEYQSLLDEMQGRVHAQVTVAREPDASTQASITRQLTAVTGRTVVPHFVVRPEILGGTIIRIGDTVMDGSVQRRLSTLRSKLLTAR
jgi:F-type H+-transporting ATPase subunit delta